MSPKKNSPEKVLRAAASRLPDVEVGIACEGTKLESATFKRGSKSFLFLTAEHARLKLDGAVGEAKKLEAKDPDRYQVGSGGWIKVTLGDGLPMKVLERWIGESYELMGAAKKKKK